jgi:predicted transposase YdaD
LKKEQDQKKKNLLKGLALVIGDHILRDHYTIAKILGVTKEMYDDIPILKERYEAGLKKGKQLGLAEGKQLGLAEGKKALRKAIIRTLEIKFGLVSNTLKTKLQKISSLIDLEALLVRSSSVSSLKEFEASLPYEKG